MATVVEVEEDNPTDEEKKTEKPAAPQKSEEVREGGKTFLTKVLFGEEPQVRDS